MGRFLNTTVARKFAMGISGLFLVLFLLMHVTVNFMSTISADIYNSLSGFMGYNFLVQLLFQPILIIVVVFRFVMRMVLEFISKHARHVPYVPHDKSSNTNCIY